MRTMGLPILYSVYAYREVTFAWFRSRTVYELNAYVRPTRTCSACARERSQCSSFSAFHNCAIWKRNVSEPPSIEQDKLLLATW